MTTIDVSALNKAYKEALPAHQEAVQAKATTAQAAMGLSLSTGVSDLAGLAGTFCEAWPKVRGFLRMAVKAMSWIPGIGNIATMALAVMTAIDKTIVPVLCGAGASEASSVETGGKKG